MPVQSLPLQTSNFYGFAYVSQLWLMYIFFFFFEISINDVTSLDKVALKLVCSLPWVEFVPSFIEQQYSFSGAAYS